MDYERYRRALEEKVCQHCLDSDEHGRCTLTDIRDCGVMRDIGKIVDAVHSVKSNKLADYVQALRGEVCSHCKNQDSHGQCQIRTNVDCGLDRFFEVIVETIEDVDAQGRSE